MKKNNNKRKNGRRPLNRWHRRLGIFTAVFVLLLAISGWLLNHTESFRLDDRHVGSTWLLDWYGIQPKQPPRSYAVGEHRVTQVDSHLYFDGRRVSSRVEDLVGGVRLDNLFVVATQETLYLLLESGQLVEQLGGAAGVPAGMQAIGTDAKNRLIIRAAHGIYTTDLDTLEWKHIDVDAVDWSRASSAPSDHLEKVLQQYRGSGLSYERVLLDLHSGRVLGQGGVWLVDIIALLFAGLAITGCIMWWRGY